MPIDIDAILKKSTERKLPDQVQDDRSFLSRLIDVGKVAGKSLLKTVGTLPTTIGETVGRELQVSPEDALSAGFGKGQSLVRQLQGLKPETDLLKAISNAGAIGKKISLKGTKSVENFINDIQALEPSQQAQRILTEGFDPEVLTTKNLERAALIFGEAVPSLGVAVGASMLTGSPLVGASLLGLSEGGTLAREAENAGASPEVAQNVAIAATVGNTLLEVVPLDFLLKGSKGVVAPFFSKIFKNIGSNPAKKAIFNNLPARVFKGFAKGFSVEGLQEATQEAYSNLIAKLSFDESRSLTQGMLDAFVGGALSGGFVGGGLSHLEQQKLDAIQKGVSEEDINTIQASLAAAVIANAEEVDSKTKAKHTNITNIQPTNIDQAIFNRTVENTGSTTHIPTQEQRNLGDVGYGVSIFPGRNTQLEKEQFTPKAVAQFREANNDLLTQPGHFLGTYINSNGKVDLDVAIVENNKRKALQLARKYGQEAIFDFQSGMNIKTAKVSQDIGEAITDTSLDRSMTLFGQFDKISSAIDKVNTIQDLQTLNDNVDIINEFVLDAGIKDQDVFKLQTELKSKLLAKIVILGKKQSNKLNQEDLTKIDPKSGVSVSIRRPSRIADILDKTLGAFNGAFSKLFINKPSIAKDNEIRERISDTEQLIELQKLAGLFPVDMKFDENFFQALKERTIDLPAGRAIMTRLNGEHISLDQALHFYAVRNNVENTQALIEGNGYTQEEINQAINLLTPEQKTFADHIVEFLQKDFSRIADVYQQITGKTIEPVVNGYVPMIRLDKVFENLEQQLEADFGQRVGLRSRGIPQGFTKARTPAEIIEQSNEAKQAPIRTGLINLSNDYIAKKAHYIHFAPLVKELRSILENEELRSAFRNTNQQAVLSIGFESLVDALAKSDPYQPHDMLGRLIEKARTNAAIAFLGANLGTIMIQAPSVGLVIPEVGMDHFLGAVSEMIQNPRDLIQSVEEQAPQIKQRSFDRVINVFKRTNPTKWEQIQRTTGSAVISGITAVDKLAVVTVWRAAQRRALAGGMSEQEANEFATQTVLRTQPAADPKDVPQVFRTQLGSLFTLFQNQLSNLFELTTDAKRRMQGGKVGQGLATMSGVMLQMLAVWMLRHQRVPTEEDDLKDFGLSFLNLIPLIGSTLNSQIRSPFFSGLPAPLFPIEKLADVGSSILKQDYAGATEDALEALGVGGGIPAFEPAKRAVKASYNILTGQKDDLRTLGFSKYNITPPSQRKKAKNAKRARSKRKRTTRG